MTFVSRISVARALFATAALASITALTPALAAAPLHILVDPGHGGADSGAVRGSLKESVIALKVSKILAEMLKKDGRFTVTMTRETDRRLELDQRTQIAKDVKADVFLSIHLNTNSDPRVHGEEFYFQNQLPADEDMLYLANRENERQDDDATHANDKLSSETDVRVILEDLGRNHRIRSSGDLSKVLFENWAVANGKKIASRSIRQAPFRVVSKVNIPSVLCELGFLSNPVEGPKLNEPNYQTALAKSLYDGLVKFKETMDKDPERALHSPP
jgi:N-acetylmuramoyl-L-alanine amidase